MKKNRIKEKFLEELRELPIVDMACRKLGISRQSYYKWRKEDVDFFKESNEALSQGESKINDMAVSNVIRGIQNQSESYTKYWLSCRHPKFSKPYERNSHEGDVNIFVDVNKIKDFEDKWFKQPEDKDIITLSSPKPSSNDPSLEPLGQNEDNNN